MQKPIFETLDGDAIFPESDELWHLTDVSRTLMNEEGKIDGDEDGPPSDFEEEKQEEVSDSDAESKVGGVY